MHSRWNRIPAAPLRQISNAETNRIPASHSGVAGFQRFRRCGPSAPAAPRPPPRRRVDRAPSHISSRPGPRARNERLDTPDSPKFRSMRQPSSKCRCPRLGPEEPVTPVGESGVASCGVAAAPSRQGRAARDAPATMPSLFHMLTDPLLRLVRSRTCQTTRQVLEVEWETSFGQG